MTCRVSVNTISSEIAGTDLRVSIPRWRHIYAIPFLPFYPLLAYAYYVKYDQWLRSEEWTFLACVLLGASHALSFLVTRWNARAKGWITTRKARVRHVLFQIALTPDSGTFTRRGGLHSHYPCSSSWAGRDRTPPQTRPIRSCDILVQLSTRHILRAFRWTNHFRSAPVPIVYAPASFYLS